VEGVVLCPVGLSAGHLLKLKKNRLPLVLVDRFFPDHDLPYVSSDNLTGTREAVELLIGQGHRRIACLQGLRGTSPNELRVRGYREALVAHRLPVVESLIVGDSFTELSGYIETKLLIRSCSDITAILALSNLNALGAIRALTEERLSVPGDISIIAFDDTPYASYLATPMTTVSQASAEMGDVAIKLLFDQIHSPQTRVKGGILLPTTLVLRKSIRTLHTASLETPSTGGSSNPENKGIKSIYS
jgi:LacI family transcriptional regulator